MSRVRLLSTAVVVTALAGCAVSPAPPPVPAPPQPTAPVGADGHPVRSLCDLLGPGDLRTAAGLVAIPPTAPPAATGATADCDYGPGIRLAVRVGTDPVPVWRDQVRAARLSSTEDGPIGGVDASVYGRTPDGAAIVLRRRDLVVTITLPDLAAGRDRRLALIQLAATVLSRANALGT